MNLPIKVFILVAVAVHFYPSTGFKSTSSPHSPLVVVLGKNTKDVTLSWLLTFDNGDFFSNLKIYRFKKDVLIDKSNIRLFYRDSSGFTNLLSSSLYSVNISSMSNGPSTGYVILTIKDIMQQPNNADGSVYKPLSEVYVYRLTVTVPNLAKDQKSETEIVIHFPTGNPTVQVQPAGPSCQGKHVNLTCNTTVGNPKDTTLTFYRNNQVVKTVSGTLNSNEAKATIPIAMIAGINSFTCAANNSIGSSERSAAVNITAKEPPEITNCTNEIAVEGTNLVWTCNATGSQPLTFSWFKENNNTAITSGNTLNKAAIKRADAGMYRFTVSNRDECPTASTTVYLTVQCEYSIIEYRMYRFTVSNRDECPTASTTVYLTVQYIPGIPTIQVQPVQSVSCEGKHVNLTCNTTVGIPANTTLITFYRNNQVVRTVIGTLNGNDAKATVTITLRAGINSFTCQANNSIGLSERSAAVNITAKEPPVITNCTNETAVEGANLVWTCNATGSRPLKTSWLKDNNVVASGNTLNETSIKRSDAGMYRFNVSNGDECLNASTTVYLTVQYPPNITSQGQDCKLPTVSENQKNTLKLVCNATGEPTPKITWTQNGVPLSKQGSPLVLQNVVRNQTGNYTCTADNGVGRADTACWKLDVRYKPEQMQIVNTQGGFMDVDEWQSINITCKAKGIPHPYYHWTHHGVLRDSEVNNTIIIKHAVLGDAGVYVCTAVNDVGSSSITVTLRVNYIRNATCDVTPNPSKEGDTIQFNCSAAGYPPVNYMYTWTSGEHEPSTTVKAILSLSGATLTCKATNRLGTRTCSTTIHYIWSGRLKINKEFTKTLQDENSSDFKALKKQCEAMLNQTYENSTDVVESKVTRFSNGSVIVDYQLTLTSNVSDPSLLLKQALNSSGGTLNGLKIDYSSIQAGVYVPPPTTTTTTAPAPTTGPPTTAAVPVTTKPPITIETIIGIVVGAVAFIIIIIVLIVCCCKKKKAKKSSINGSWNVGKDENNVGMDNRGASPSPSTYARHGPHPSTSTQPTNNNQDNNDVAPTYAQVDIKKKTPKKKSGEMTYAALSEFQKSGSETHGKGGIQLEPLPKDKVKMPPKYEETDYAEIVVFQRAREEKKAHSSDKQDTVADTWSGSFEITNKEFNNTMQDENSSDFKALKEQCEAMLNQTYENNTVAGEPKVKGFRCLSNDSVIVDYQLTLTANVSDPSLLLKQALNNNGGTLNELAIDYSSIQAETDEKPKSEETAEKERKEVTPPNLQPSSTQSSQTPNSEDTAVRGQEATASSQTSVDSSFTRDRNGTTLTTVSL